MSDTDEPDFYGFLASVSSNDGDVELRFHPFVFSPEADARPVFAVSFSGARFLESRLEALVDQEIEVTISATRAELYDLFAGDMIVLEAKAVTADWATHDKSELLRHIRKADAGYDRLTCQLGEALDKERKLKSVTGELLRRAQIKAAASDEHRVRQAAAIEVLGRIVKELEDDA